MLAKINKKSNKASNDFLICLSSMLLEASKKLTAIRESDMENKAFLEKKYRKTSNREKSIIIASEIKSFMPRTYFFIKINLKNENKNSKI